MKWIVRWRWIIAILWIAALVGLNLLAPDMGKLVREKGQIRIPEGSSSSIAAKLAAQGDAKDGDRMSVVLVFHNDNGLSAADMTAVEQSLRKLQDEKDELAIAEMTSFLTDERLKEELVSKDNKTVLALLSVNREGQEVHEIRNRLEAALADASVAHYLTGAALVNEDVVLSSEQGLKRTEWITVIFILTVLILVFRSPVAPLIPLLTVGISYLVSMHIVAYLVDLFNFPLSTFTQIFLVAVLFGIGTDYCILLLSRFKEELAGHGNINDAIIDTYKTAGRTVMFSGLAAFAGFASIGLAKFNLYQSAAAVAVGVLVLMVALTTIVPLFMKVLGKRLFWPIRGSLEHKQSKMWGMAGTFALKRPVYALLIVAVIVVPLIASYSGKLSFDSLNELGDDYDSVKAFNLIADSFTPGEALPAKIVFAADAPLDSPEGLALIEKISAEVANVSNVAKVRSATRPLGTKLAEFTVSSQLGTLGNGLEQSRDGIDQIKDGLAEAHKSLTDSQPKLAESVVQVNQLAEGTVQLKDGVDQLHQGLARIAQGLDQGAVGMEQLGASMDTLQQSAAQLADAASRLSAGYGQMGDGLAKVSAGYEQIGQNARSISQALNEAAPLFDALAGKYPELKNDRDFGTLQAVVGKSREGAAALADAVAELNGTLQTLHSSLQTANERFADAVAGQTRLAAGLAEVNAAFAKLRDGLQSAAAGQRQAVAKLPEMSAGMGQIASGQQQFSQGFAAISDQLGKLSEGLGQSATGLGEVSKGLEQAQNYVAQVSADKAETGLHIPQEALANEEMQRVFAQFLSADRTVATFDVILRTNPYSTESMDTIKPIHDAVQRAVSGTSFANAKFGIDGVTGMNADLRQVSREDYNRTVALMLIAIGLILIVLLRSVIMPLYLMAGLIVCYFASLAVNQLVFVNLLGYPGTNWTIPFFAFVILMALGVDYSIFMMDRFNEYKGQSAGEAVLLAMKNMGTVIMSAAIILAGTFAAMLPSGVLSMLQIATAVLTGLLLYALIILPLFVPVMVRIFGQHNWWPFARKRQ